MSNFEIYEVVKEFEIYVGFESVQKVRAKIYKMIDTDFPNPYKWSISHYYKPHEDAISVYIPSVRMGETVEDVELSLMGYIRDFKDIETSENENF